MTKLKPPFVVPKSGTLWDYARAYAAIGWKVHPLNERDKTPLTPHGFKDATDDQTTIERWWTAFPNANIGIATGATSGFIVLDVDGEPGWRSLDDLETQYGQIQATLSSDTRKGSHLLFKHPGGVLRNSVADIGKGLDTRADGGYIVAPPSIHPSGAEYQWAAPIPLADPPEWLVDAMRHKERAPRVDALTVRRYQPLQPVESTEIIPYVKVVIANKLNKRCQDANYLAEPWVEGQRNRKLYDTALLFGRIALAGLADQGYLERELYDAAITAGLDHTETMRTINSGMKNGLNSGDPYTVPENPRADPLPSATPQQRALRAAPGKVVIKRGSDYGRRKINFFWGYRIPMGKLTIIAGPAKLGKSYATVALAAHITAGESVPDSGNQVLRGDVLYCSYEDDVEDTIGPRCDELGVDMDKMHFIEHVRVGEEQRDFGPQDVNEIVDYLRNNPQIKMVVIDPLGSFMGAAVDANAENQVRAVLSTLTKTAQETNAAIVIVAHFKKGEAESTIHKVAGSQGISAIARSVLVVGEKDGVRAIAHAAHNLSAKAPTVEYTFENGKFEWGSVRPDLNDEVLTISDRGKADPVEEAVRLIRRELNREPCFDGELTAIADAHGIPSGVLDRAKGLLGLPLKATTYRADMLRTV